MKLTERKLWLLIAFFILVMIFGGGCAPTKSLTEECYFSEAAYGQSVGRETKQLRQ